MSLLEKAKQLFTGDNETTKNIPEAFRLLDELIEQNNIDAIKLKLQFLSQIGNQLIAISSIDVEFEKNRPSQGYSDSELKSYFAKGSELAAKEKLQRLDDSASSQQVKTDISLVIAHPILKLLEKCFSLGTDKCGYTLAIIYFNGEHKHYPQLHITPNFNQGIAWLRNTALRQDFTSIIELMRIYVGVPTIVLNKNYLPHALIEFQSIREATNLYTFAHATIDNEDSTYEFFFSVLEKLKPKTDPVSTEEDLLITIDLITSYIDMGNITEAKKLLKIVDVEIEEKPLASDTIRERLSEIKEVLYAVSQEENENPESPKMPLSPRTRKSYRPDFFEPAEGSSSTRPSNQKNCFPQPYFPSITIQHRYVETKIEIPPVLLVQSSLEMTFGENAIPSENIMLLQEFFENCDAPDATLAAGEIFDLPRSNQNQQFCIWFDPSNKTAMKIFEDLKTFIQEVLNIELTTSEKNHESLEEKGKGSLEM